MTDLLALANFGRFERRCSPSPIGSPPAPAWFRPAAEAAPEAAALVHLVDMDPGTREALARLLAAEGLESRGHEDISDFLAAVRPDVPACLVVDVRPPTLDSLELATRLQEAAMPVIVTARRPDVFTVVAALKAGAVEFLERPFLDRDLLQAVTTALDADRSRRTSEARRAEVRERFARLTRREREVMALVTAGRLNKQVAGDLGLSEITVKVHRGSVMRKMGARTLVDLVRMADTINKPEPRSSGAPQNS